MDRVRRWWGVKMLALALLSAPQPALAQAPVATPLLSPDLQMGLRCAALLSLVAGEQARGAPGAADWLPLAMRGREFFVRIAARVMDEAKVDRAGIVALVRAEVASLQDRAAAQRNPATSAAALKAPCLVLLEATLPTVR